MELWERDDIDMMRPGYIRFNRNGTGDFHFAAVQGEMDCRVDEREGRRMVEFSWSGCDEMDQSCGRGWAALDANNTLHGRLFFHFGDESGFTAIPERKMRKPSARRANLRS